MAQISTPFGDLSLRVTGKDTVEAHGVLAVFGVYYQAGARFQREGADWVLAEFWGSNTRVSSYGASFTEAAERKLRPEVQEAFYTWVFAQNALVFTRAEWARIQKLRSDYEERIAFFQNRIDECVARQEEDRARIAALPTAADLGLPI